MPKNRSRKLTVVMTAGALTMFGAAGAFAAEEGPGSAGGGQEPMCKGTPLATTPLCAPPSQQPPGDGGPGSPSASPAGHGGDHGGGGGEAPLPLCGPPLTATGVCDKPGNEGDDNGGDNGAGSGGSKAPSAQPTGEGGGAGQPNQPFCNETPLQATPICAPAPGQGGGGGKDSQPH